MTWSVWGGGYKCVRVRGVNCECPHAPALRSCGSTRWGKSKRSPYSKAFSGMLWQIFETPPAPSWTACCEPFSPFCLAHLTIWSAGRTVLGSVKEHCCGPIASPIELHHWGVDPKRRCRWPNSGLRCCAGTALGLGGVQTGSNGPPTACSLSGWVPRALYSLAAWISENPRCCESCANRAFYSEPHACGPERLPWTLLGIAGFCFWKLCYSSCRNAGQSHCGYGRPAHLRSCCWWNCLLRQIGPSRS